MDSRSRLITPDMAAFVGRSAEIATLASRLQAATGGRPAIVLLDGEAGIGKTRLLKELRASTMERGVNVVSARCHEDLSLPFLPFAQSLLPELERHATRLPDLLAFAQVIGAHLRPSHPPQDAGGRLDLFLAVSNSLLKYAEAQPLLFVIDDLQWADASSLDLFEHICFSVADAAETRPVRVMIVAASRTPDAGTPLHQSLARVRRESICSTLSLTRLEPLEVHALLSAIGVPRPSTNLTESVARASQGNPYLVTEIVSFLRERDALKLEAAGTVSALPEASFPLPAELAAPIMERVSQLSEECRALLLVAAQLERPFGVNLLAAVAGLARAEALDLLDEAIAANLVAAEGDEFQFAHPITRGVIYRALTPVRRREAHNRIAARFIEHYGDASREHALEIAHHLTEAGDEAPRERLALFARRAGDVAAGLYAWADAARFYEAAIAVLAPDEPDRAGLYYGAAYAHHHSANLSRALELYELAVAAFRAQGNARSVAIALVEMVNARVLSGPGVRPDTAPLEDALAALPDDDRLAAKLRTELAQTNLLAGDLAAAESWSRQALACAGPLEDHENLAKAQVILAGHAARRLDFTTAAECYEAAIAEARKAGDDRILSIPLQRAPAVLLTLGRLDEAAALAREGHALGRRTGGLGGTALAAGALISLDVLRGDFAAAAVKGKDAAMLIERSGYVWAVAPVYLPLAAAAGIQGHWQDAEAALAPAPLGHRAAALFLALLRARKAIAEGSAIREPLVRLPGLTDNDFLGAGCAAIELAALGGAQYEIEDARAMLQTAQESGARFTSGWPFCVERALALAAALRGEDAAPLFEEALASCEAAGAVTELAHACVDYAGWLARGAGAGADARVAALLERAAPLLAELGMETALKTARRIAASLNLQVDALGTAEGAVSSVATEEAPVAATREQPVHPPVVQTMAVVLFTDVVDSVPFTERLGDLKARELFDRLHVDMSAAIEDCGGTMVEGVNLGDGLLSTFTSARQAIDAAIRCRARARALGIELHVGLHAGDILRHGKQISGGTVNIAARVRDACPAGEIFVSGTVRDLARTSTAATFEDRGVHNLKGVGEAQRLYAVQLPQG